MMHSPPWRPWWQDTGSVSFVVVVVVFFFEHNKSWTSVNSILLRYNGVGIFNCKSFGITEL